jgi:hypothetical protein
MSLCRKPIQPSFYPLLLWRRPRLISGRRWWTSYNLIARNPEQRDGREAERSRRQREGYPPLIAASRIDAEPGRQRPQDCGNARGGEEDIKDRAQVLHAEQFDQHRWYQRDAEAVCEVRA